VSKYGKIPIPTLFIDINTLGPDPGGMSLDQEMVARALRRASLEAAEMVRGVWVATAKGLGLDSDGDYIRGIEVSGQIEIDEIDVRPGAEVIEFLVTVTNTSKIANLVEEGHEAYSLVEKIRWGATPRMKRNKKGEWYLTIPFQHGAYRSEAAIERGGITNRARRTMMPQEVYAEARKLKPSRALNAGLQYTESGQYVAADRYKWGGRLATPRGKAASAVLPIAAKAAEMDRKQAAGATLYQAASRYGGMVKMSGGKGHTSYLTFRVITQKSRGWRIPARAGLYIARRLLQRVEGGELGTAIANLVDARLRAAVTPGGEAP
jgi:hypothetical protein